MVYHTTELTPELTRILLIDDDRQVLNVLTSALADCNVVTACALSVDEARAEFKRFDPQLTLVDQMLPGGRGTDLIAQFAALKPTLIQFLATGAADDHLLKLALQSGAWSVLSKPYRLIDVFEIVKLSRLIASAELLQAGIEVERDGKSAFVLNVTSGDITSAEDIALAVAFVRDHGAGPQAQRRVAELITESAFALKNITEARAGVLAIESVDDSSKNEFRLSLRSDRPQLDWRRELAHARGDMQTSRIGGLYLASCLADRIETPGDGSLSLFVHALPGEAQ